MSNNNYIFHLTEQERQILDRRDVRGKPIFTADDRLRLRRVRADVRRGVWSDEIGDDNPADFGGVE